MEREEAVQEVREIKRIMEESRRQADRRTVWVGLALLGLGILATAVLPFLAPVVGIGLIVGGIVAYRRSEDSLARGVAAVAIGMGSLLLLLVVFVVLGLMAISVGGSEALGPVDVPPGPVQSAP
jgi:hypothetical protein